MKTICFDLRALQIGHQNRGIGMYVKSVLENLPADDNTYIFYCFDKNDPIRELDITTNVTYQLVQTPTLKTDLSSPKNIPGMIRLLNHTYKNLKPYNPDVFVQFDFMLGIPQWKSMKKIVIGYDLIPLIMKNEYIPSPSAVWYRRFGLKAKLRGALRAAYYRWRYNVQYRTYERADKIVCISQNSANSFHELLGIPNSKLIVAPLAAVASDTKPDNSIQRSLAKPYLFYIGGTDDRKHVVDIVQAFNILKGRGFDALLVLAGREFRSLDKMTDEVARSAIKNSPYLADIKLLGFVSDGEKVSLYEHAHAFVFTSIYEGFGLPVIEAMAASCPVVAYNNSSIPEAADDAALLVDTGDVVAVVNALIKLTDSSLRQKLINRGHKQAATFTWNDHIAILLRSF